MTFGKTLYTLRKGRSLSQEGLANELNTSRQAVSKWENDQGFPEMDKLLMISNIFGVTVDYLLKGQTDGTEIKSVGYYASSENIEGYLIYERNTIKAVAIGIYLILMSGVPYMVIPEVPVLKMVLVTVFVLAGFGSILGACFKENNYKKVLEEPLIIDHAYLAQLRSRYDLLKKKYSTGIRTGIGLAFASMVIFVMAEEIHLPEPSGYEAVALLLFAVGVSMIVYFTAMMWAYRVVVDNSEHIKEREEETKQINFRQVLGIICLVFAVLAFVYLITGGTGRISEFIDKFISKL